MSNDITQVMYYGPVKRLHTDYIHATKRFTLCGDAVRMETISGNETQQKITITMAQARREIRGLIIRGFKRVSTVV